MELNKTFTNGLWNKEINVSDFVSKNIAPYPAGTYRTYQTYLGHLSEGSRRRKEQQWRPFTGQYHRIYHHFS